ncbi:MAG: 16S rRNA (guanine(527)-N(7))-methyltransferase RsmG [Desulfovibrionales bacterium]|nr:16S rRNA (guanine(527)-N(7))-methyltransferase RsmG [Desulfovibrionales bacterium]
MLDPSGQTAFESYLEQGCQRAGIPLEENLKQALLVHARELFFWNKKVNLTAITDVRGVADKHFLDALCAAAFIPKDIKLMDLGSGGGFPGLPLKALGPDLDLTLVDAARKKINFLKQVIRLSGFEKARALHTRVEDLHSDPAFAGQFDGVVARGFANLEKLVDLALPLLKEGGVIYSLKGEGGKGEIIPSLEDIFEIDVASYALPLGGDKRTMIRLKKRIN